MSVRGKYNNELNGYDGSFKNIEFIYENKKLKINETINIYELDENEQSLMFNSNIIRMKLSDVDEISSDLYLDDKVIKTFDYSHVIVYVTDKFLLIAWPGSTCGEIVLGYLNENLEYTDMDISVHNTDYNPGVYQENNRIFADKTIDNVELCDGSKKIEFVYEKGKVNIKDVK